MDNGSWIIVVSHTISPLLLGEGREACRRRSGVRRQRGELLRAFQRVLQYGGENKL